MVSSRETENRNEDRREEERTRVFEVCEKGELGRVCGHADDRRQDTSDLMGYDYEGSYRVQIPWIGVRGSTCYEGSVPALTVVGS